MLLFSWSQNEKSFPPREPIKTQIDYPFKLSGQRTTCAQLVHTGLEVLQRAQCCSDNKRCVNSREKREVLVCCGVACVPSNRRIFNSVSLLEHLEWNIALGKHALGQRGFLQHWWFHYCNRKMSRENKSRPKPMWGLYHLIWYTPHKHGLRLSSPPSDTVFMWKLPL